MLPIERTPVRKRLIGSANRPAVAGVIACAIIASYAAVAGAGGTHNTSATSQYHGQAKVTICHHTASATNPDVTITVGAAAERAQGLTTAVAAASDRRFKAHTEGAPQELCSRPVGPTHGAYHFIPSSGAFAFKARTWRTRARARHARDCGRGRRSLRRFWLSDQADTLGSVRGRALQTGTGRWNDSSQRFVKRKRAGLQRTRQLRHGAGSQR